MQKRPGQYGVHDLIQWAKEGDVTAARELLYYFRVRVKFPERFQSMPPPNELHEWLADAFKSILRGEDPAKALGLKRKRGRPTGRSKCTPTEMSYARAVNRLVDQEDYSQPEAVKVTAEFYGISRRRVAECYGKCIPKKFRAALVKKKTHRI